MRLYRQALCLALCKGSKIGINFLVIVWSLFSFLQINWFHLPDLLSPEILGVGVEEGTGVHVICPLCSSCQLPSPLQPVQWGAGLVPPPERREGPPLCSLSLPGVGGFQPAVTFPNRLAASSPPHHPVPSCRSLSHSKSPPKTSR